MRRIAFVTETLSAVSGGVRCIIEQLNGLKRRGYDVVCYVQKDEGVSWLPSYFPILPVSRCKDEEVLVSPYTPTAEIVANADAQYKFYYAHAYEPLFPRPSSSGWKQLSEQSYRLPLMIFCTSRTMKILLEAFYDRRTIDVTVPGGVNLHHFEAVEPAQNEFTVFVMDRHSTFRGVDDAMEGIRLAQRFFPDIKVIMTGSDAPPPSAAGVSNLEYVTHNDQDILANLYGRSSVYINASYREGFPLPVIEAMACKTAVITTPWGTQDVIYDRITGCLVPSRNPESIGKTLMLLYKDRRILHRLVDNAYAAVQSYTWAHSVARLEAALKEGIASPEKYLNPVDHYGAVL